MINIINEERDDAHIITIEIRSNTTQAQESGS